MVKYYQEGGPPNCRNEDETEKLGLSFGVAPLPREGTESTHAEPRIGDSLAVCVLGVLGEEEVRVSIAAPKGALPDLVDRGYGSPGEFGLVLRYLFLDPRYGWGQWRFKAQAGERTARMVVSVGKAAAPGYVHSETREHRYADFVIVGLGPRQRFSMHFYTPRDDELLADYVSSATGRREQTVRRR